MPIIAGQVLLGGALVAFPWFLGGVQASVYFWLFPLVLLALVCCLVAQFRKEAASVPLPTAIVPLVLALGLALLQLTPVPSFLLSFVAPRNVQLWQNLTAPASVDPADEGRLAFDLSLMDAAGSPTISLYPESTRRGFALLILAAAVFYLGVSLFSSEKQPIRLFIALAVLGIAMAFFGIAQQLTWNGKIYGFVSVPQNAHSFAAFVNRNNAGGFLNICLAAAVGLTVWAFSRKEARSGSALAARIKSSPILRESMSVRWAAHRLAGLATACADFSVVNLLGATAMVFIAAGVACSLSRGAWLSTAGGIVAVAIVLSISRRSRLWFLVLLPLALAAFGLVAWVGKTQDVQARLDTLRTGAAVQAEVRLGHWQDGARAAWDFPLLGSGLGTYRYVYRIYEQNPVGAWFQHADNQYLETLVESGLLGAGLMLGAGLLLLMACYRLLREPKHSTAYACGVAGIFALTSQAIHAGFDFGLTVPANMAVFAALFGAIAGRAANAAYRQDRFRTKFSYRLRALLLSLPSARPVAAACAGILIVGVAWGTNQVRTAARLEAAVNASEPPKNSQDTTDAELASRIMRLGMAIANHPDEAEAQRRLAKLWIGQFRLESFDALRKRSSNKAQENVAWNLSSPSQVHARIQDLKRQARELELESLRRSPEVKTNLTNAVRHLLLARKACPLLADVHMLLAELTPAVSRTAAADNHLRRVRQVAAANPDLWAECGLVAFQAGQVEDALADWQRCTQLDGKRFPAFLKIVIEQPTLRPKLDSFLPDAPELLIQAAAQLQSSNLHPDVQGKLLVKADRLLNDRKLAKDQQHYLRGRIRALQKQTSQAIEDYSVAVDLRPNELEWRYELSVLLESAGRIEDAKRQAADCLRMEPTNARYEALYRKLIQYTRNL